METMSDFTVTSTITYRPYRIPPRCRKERQVLETFKHEFQIPCVTSEAAPVVALVPDDRNYYGAPVGEDAPLRGYDGKLYIAETRGGKPVMAGSGAFRARNEYESWHAGRYEAINEAGKRFSDILIIDGEVWKPIPEPAYAIVTMGMGGNYGGTYLEIDYAGRYDRRFPLTDYDGAVAAALAFAEKRGDTNTIPNIRKTPKATILEPTAFKIPSETDALAAAQAEIHALAEQARNILSGTLTRASLTEAKEMAEKAANVFWHHDIEELPAQ
jgi:hypothetical protein